jgi:hypothetical protein
MAEKDVVAAVLEYIIAHCSSSTLFRIYIFLLIHPSVSLKYDLLLKYGVRTELWMGRFRGASSAGEATAAVS